MSLKIRKETKQRIIQGIMNSLNAFFVILILVLGFISVFNKDLMLRILEWIEQFIQGIGFWNYFVAFFSSLLEAFPVIGVVLPGQNIMLLVATFFAKASRTNLVFIYILASIGAVIGNYIGYLLGKKYGDSFFKKYGIRFGVGMTEVKYLKKGIQKWGPLGITFGKFHNVTRAFLPFIAGSMGMKEKSFIIYNIIGSILRAITIITLGVVFGKYYETIISYAGTIFAIIVILVIAYMYFFKREKIKEYMREKSKELDNL